MFNYLVFPSINEILDECRSLAYSEVVLEFMSLYLKAVVTLKLIEYVFLQSPKRNENFEEGLFYELFRNFLSDFTHLSYDVIKLTEMGVLVAVFVPILLLVDTYDALNPQTWIHIDFLLHQSDHLLLMIKLLPILFLCFCGLV